VELQAYNLDLGMQATVKTQIVIRAEPTKIFKYLADLKCHHFWNPQVQSFSSTEALKLGSKYQTESQILGVKIKSNNEVTKFVRDKEIEISNAGGTVKYRANFKLQPKNGGTSVVCATTVSTEGEAFAFAKPVLKLLARRELQSDLQALKLAVEHNLK
jgi:carbon monoxide dehydrogenase subunit G